MPLVSLKMAKTLEKTRKQISKKRNGVVDSLHEFSRDSRRLRRALLRDERLEKMAGSRKKNNKPLCLCPYFSYIVLMTDS